MSVRKVTVSLDENAYAIAQRMAEAAGMSLSAWLSGAAVDAARVEAGLAAVADYERESGAFDPEELAKVDRELDRLGIGMPVSPESEAQARDALRRLRAGELDRRGEAPASSKGA